MSLNERSRESQAIVYRNLNDGSLVWDTLPTGPGSESLIQERISQGFVPVASGNKVEVLKTVSVDQQKIRGRFATLLGNIIG